MKFHDELNPALWTEEDLIPEVKEKLEEIAEAFIEFLEIPTDAVLDKVITGSSASYNYNKYSDLDLHIIVDYDKVHEDCPLVNGYLNSLKKQFNDNHDITIHGVPVELYAEQKDQGTVHNGLYSLQTGWIDKPQKIEPTDNDAAVEAKFNEIKELVDKCDDSEEATELLDKIYTMRKAGLAEAGEFCTENLAFKKLRNEGCMDKLRQIKKEQIDKQLSLESYNENIDRNVVQVKIVDGINFGYFEVDGKTFLPLLKESDRNATVFDLVRYIGDKNINFIKGNNTFKNEEITDEYFNDMKNIYYQAKEKLSKNESIKEDTYMDKYKPMYDKATELAQDRAKIDFVSKMNPQDLVNYAIKAIKQNDADISDVENMLYKANYTPGQVEDILDMIRTNLDEAESAQKNEANKYSTEEYRAMALNLAKKVAKNAPKAAKQATATFKVYVGPYDYSILLPYNFTDKECSDAEEYARLMGIPYNKINISALVGNNPKYSVDEEAVIIYPSGKVSDLDGNTIKLESAQKNEDSYVESIKEISVDEDIDTLEQKIDAADTTLKDLMDRLNSVTEEIEDTEFTLEKANNLIDEALRED